MRSTLIFLEYLQSGLIPVNGFWPESISEFEKLLSSLSVEDRRVANRKFRKIFRKISKRYVADKNKPTAGWKKVYGVGDARPTKAQLRNRRRLVHEEISKMISRRMEDA